MKASCLLLGLTALLLCGCDDKRELRSYVENRNPVQSKAKRSTGPSSLNVPPGTLPDVEADLAWDLPEGWSEQAGSGMRMATLYAGEGAAKVETSLIAFQDSGGVRTNLERWLGQLNIKMSGDRISVLVDELPALSNDSGLAGNFADLTTLTKDGAASMLAGILTLPDGRTLYVKATGAHEALVAARPSFLSLCQSIRDSDA